MKPEIAVMLPCYNEAVTIGQVVADFRAALPEARIYVFDNASTDETAALARAAGATVIREPRKGKGNVVRRMFAEVDADIYLMADGDGTYSAADAPKLIDALVSTRSDMAIGARSGVRQDAGRRGHALGNRLFNFAYSRLFGNDYTDIFSGYRAFSRRFAKSFPALSHGFEIETEMSVFASQLRLPTVELDLPYGKRPEGSSSKLSSVKDGLRIFGAFLALFKTIKPATFFGTIASGVAMASLVLAFPLFVEYLQTGLVPRMPTALLCTGMMIVSLLLAMSGLVIGAVTRAQAENMRLFYLAMPANRVDPTETVADDGWNDAEKSAALRLGGERRASA